MPISKSINRSLTHKNPGIRPHAPRLKGVGFARPDEGFDRDFAPCSQRNEEIGKQRTRLTSWQIRSPDAKRVALNCHSAQQKRTVTKPEGVRRRARCRPLAMLAIALLLLTYPFLPHKIRHRRRSIKVEATSEQLTEEGFLGLTVGRQESLNWFCRF